MVKLTADLVAKQTVGHNKRRADETIEHYLSRLTHLSFPNRNIDSIANIPPCRLLTVIYLYDNFLVKVPDLSFAENLTDLYLQNNRINKLENLNTCLKLKKLYAGGNQIQVVEGLERCVELIEMHIENQRLPEGETLVFEPRTLQTLSHRLETLNISGNNLDSLAELSCLENLQELIANNNRLTNIREVSQLLSIWPCIKRLDTSRNPICSKMRYRERLIVVSTTLEMLDGKQIPKNSKDFLMNWKASREAHQLRDKSKIALFEYSSVGDYQRNAFGIVNSRPENRQFPISTTNNISQKQSLKKARSTEFISSNPVNKTTTLNSNNSHGLHFHDVSMLAFQK